jgi:hypothetical protein
MFRAMQHPRNTLLLSGLALLLVPALNARAQDPKIQMVPSQKELILSGHPGNDASLTQRITLLSDKQVQELLFRPGDLQRDGGTETISRSQIQSLLSTKLSLPENTPQDFDFKVSGIKVPGTYSGVIEFLLPQHGTAAALHLTFKLQVEETPRLALRKGSENIKIQLVNCSMIGCYLGANLKFLNIDPLQDHSFPLDNGSLLPFAIDGSAAATGDVNSGYTGDSIKLGLPMTVPPKPIVTIPLHISSGELVPDHYVGDVQLRIPAKDEPLKIPLELNVKTGPELPILVLLIGILFGRLIKYMQDKGTPQSTLLYQLLQLQTRAGQNPADLALLHHLFEGARQDIDSMRLDQVKADLTLIGNRLTLLARLRYLETLLTPRAADPGVPAILADIALARNQVSLEADPTPTAARIETEVQNLAAPGGPPNPAARAMEMAAARGVRSAVTITVAAAAPAADAHPPHLSWFRRVVGFITGHADALRANFTLWFLRPALWIVLILLLTGTGFMQLYVKNPIFGANFISDYFGLLVWATGSDVASRTLSNFKGS